MTNLSTYSPNKIRRSNCLAYWRYTTAFYRVSIGDPLSMLETQGLDLQRMYKLLIRYASPRNIDTKLSRYSGVTLVSNYAKISDNSDTLQLPMFEISLSRYFSQLFLHSSKPFIPNFFTKLFDRQ